MIILHTTDTHYGIDSRTHASHESFLRKIKKLKFDLCVHSGDWASDRQDNLYRSLKMFRGALDCPILTVMGNHDYWDVLKKGDIRYKKATHASYQTMVDNHLKWCKEFNIHYLTDMGPYVHDDIIFLGYDGWYANPYPPTKDSMRMPTQWEGASCHTSMLSKAAKDLYRLLDTPTDQYRKVVAVTHFPPFLNPGESEAYREFCAPSTWLDFIADKCDYLMVGHSHKQCDFVYKECRLLNPGAEYNGPKYHLIEI